MDFIKIKKHHVSSKGRKRPPPSFQINGEPATVAEILLTKKQWLMLTSLANLEGLNISDMVRRGVELLEAKELLQSARRAR